MGNEMVSATHSSKIHSEKWSHKPNHVSREHGNLLTTEESGLTSHSGRYEHRPSGLTVYRDVALTKWVAYQHPIVTLLDLTSHERVCSAFLYICRESPKWIIFGRTFRGSLSMKCHFHSSYKPLIFVENTRCTVSNICAPTRGLGASNISTDRLVRIFKLDVNHWTCCNGHGTWEKILLGLVTIEQNGAWALCMINNCSFDKKALLLQ
jgi:hypothetical protein